MIDEEVKDVSLECLVNKLGVSMDPCCPIAICL